MGHSGRGGHVGLLPFHLLFQPLHSERHLFPGVRLRAHHRHVEVHRHQEEPVPVPGGGLPGPDLLHQGDRLYHPGRCGELPAAVVGARVASCVVVHRQGLQAAKATRPADLAAGTAPRRVSGVDGDADPAPLLRGRRLACGPDAADVHAGQSTGQLRCRCGGGSPGRRRRLRRGGYHSRNVVRRRRPRRTVVAPVDLASRLRRFLRYLLRVAYHAVYQPGGARERDLAVAGLLDRPAVGGEG